jgi:tRNA threonylcarbamoyladenosine biosynthesis protein TsaE
MPIMAAWPLCRYGAKEYGIAGLGQAARERDPRLRSISAIKDGAMARETVRSTTPALQVRSTSHEQTRRLGAALGELLAAGDVVLLSGELGAGKTAFAQGIGAGLGVAGTINSPTFTIVKEYAGRLPLYHFDLYRIEEPDELFALGFDDVFGGEGVAVVEWAERGEDEEMGAAWPECWLRVELRATAPNERTLRVTAAGARGHELLATFAETGVAETGVAETGVAETGRENREDA